MLKIITHFKKTNEIMDVLVQLEKNGYRWMWPGIPEGVPPTRFIGWKYLVVRHRKLHQEKGMCLSLDEDQKQIIELGLYKPPIEEFCEITHRDFLFEITQS